MPPPPEDAAEIESLRTYLLFVAQQLLDPALRVRAAPSDLVQQTFLQAHESRDTYRGTTREEHLAWLRRILINLIRNHHRRASETQSRSVDRELPFLPGFDDPIDEDTPSRIFGDQERQRRLAEVVASLPDDYRRVLALRFDEDCSFAEIGRRLGRSEAAANMLFQRAIGVIRGTPLPSL